MSPQKKETLKKILEALVPYRELAQWFLLLLKEDWNDEIKENLYQIIINEIRQIKDENKIKKIKKSLKIIKEKELKEKIVEDKYLNDLINNI